MMDIPAHALLQMDRSNLIVNYLPSAYGEDDLRQLFCKFGKIQSIKVRA
jgi:hypothetical protein